MTTLRGSDHRSAGTPGGRWAPEQVEAIAPSPRSYRAALALSEPVRWSRTGASGSGVWGHCDGSSGEPYEVVVDHVAVRTRCSCPSRRQPCKHALGLLLAWSRGDVPDVEPPVAVARWLDRSPSPSSDAGTNAGTDTGIETDTGTEGAAGSDTGDRSPRPPAPDPSDRTRGRDERIAQLTDGLRAFDTWLADRLRLGLADPSVADPDAWEQAAARLVDAGARSLANRVRRVARSMSAGPTHLATVVAEIGRLHALTQAALRLPSLPVGLADAVATATGWQVRQADVLAGVPEPDTWFVVGRNDTREDRIEVRRWWLRGVRTRRWAMVLSFAAHGDGLEEPFEVGTGIDADLYRYPGATSPDGGLRALVPAVPAVSVDVHPDHRHVTSVADGCDEVGRILACEPWTERVPMTVLAAPARGDRGWVLTDHTSSVPLVAEGSALAILLTASAGRPVPVGVEWTIDGAVPIAVHLEDRSIDIGRRAGIGWQR